MRKGSKHTLETIRKLSLSHIGIKQTDEAKRKIAVAMAARRHTPEMKARMSIARMGSKNPMWVQQATNYQTIHSWIVKKYGKASTCKSTGCTKRSSTFDWALRHEFSYERKVKNFIQLCRSCHNKYDGKGFKVT